MARQPTRYHGAALRRDPFAAECRAAKYRGKPHQNFDSQFGIFESDFGWSISN
jgi:hypothetical protein